MSSKQLQPWRPRSSAGLVAVATVLRPILAVATRRRWSGLQHIPPTGGVIIAVNHLSYVDPLLVGHLLYDAGRIPRFMGKAELFTWPVVGPVMRVAGQIPVHRNGPDAASALDDAVRALAAGECVVIYPEGTVTRDPDGWPMAARTGVARLARVSGAPVIPVAQWGAHRILGRGRHLHLLSGRSRHTISVLVGPAVDLDTGADEGDPMDVLTAATGRVMAAITGQLAELRGEPAPTVPAGTS